MVSKYYYSISPLQPYEVFLHKPNKKEKKKLISQTDGNKGGSGNFRQDVPSHHMQYSFLLQITLVTNAKT